MKNALWLVVVYLFITGSVFVVLGFLHLAGIYRQETISEAMWALRVLYSSCSYVFAFGLVDCSGILKIKNKR